MTANPKAAKIHRNRAWYSDLSIKGMMRPIYWWYNCKYDGNP